MDLAQEGDVLGQRLRPFNAQSWTGEHHQHSVVAVDLGYTPNGQAGRKTVVELTANGILFAAVELPKKPVPHGAPKDAIGFIPFHACEGELFERLRSYLKILHACGLQGPFYFGVTLHRIKDMILAPQYGDYDAQQLRPFKVENVQAEPVIINVELPFDSPKAMGVTIQAAMDELWRAAGLPHDPYLRL
jgi:hypothetical protein